MNAINSTEELKALEVQIKRDLGVANESFRIQFEFIYSTGWSMNKRPQGIMIRYSNGYGRRSSSLMRKVMYKNNEFDFGKLKEKYNEVWQFAVKCMDRDAVKQQEAAVSAEKILERKKVVAAMDTNIVFLSYGMEYRIGGYSNPTIEVLENSYTLGKLNLRDEEELNAVLTALKYVKALRDEKAKKAQA